MGETKLTSEMNIFKSNSTCHLKRQLITYECRANWREIEREKARAKKITNFVENCH